MNLAELNKIAEAMVAPGRGILAADESSGTIKKRFDAIGADCTADNRRDYREFLFRSSEAMSKYISGVILYDETIRQNAKDGTPLVKLIEKAGALPGIKVDKGTKPLPFSPGELITEGLDGLRERLAEYRGLGAKFAKWRAVIDIGDGIPSYAAIITNAHALARYAALCQEEGIVPIVEPEVLMDGDHDADRCYVTTEWLLKTVFEQLYYQKVAFEGMVLKPNMVISGKKAKHRAGAELVSTSINSLTCGPFSPSPIRTLTRAPSGTPLCPAASSTLMCMNASDPPTTATNPKPFSALNHLTIASTGSDACGALGLGLIGRLSAARSWGV
jgi:fructose-bisphosphate aldolase class I